LEECKEGTEDAKDIKYNEGTKDTSCTKNTAGTKDIEDAKKYCEYQRYCRF